MDVKNVAKPSFSANRTLDTYGKKHVVDQNYPDEESIDVEETLGSRKDFTNI